MSDDHAGEVVAAALAQPVTAWPDDAPAVLEVMLDDHHPRPASAKVRLDGAQADLTTTLKDIAASMARLVRELAPFWADAAVLTDPRGGRRASRLLGPHATPLLCVLRESADIDALLRAAPLEAAIGLFHDLLRRCFPDRPLVLLLQVDAPPDAAAAVCQENAILWLAAHFPSPIWAAGEASAAMTRLPQAHSPLGLTTSVGMARPEPLAIPSVTPPAGKPHPGSAAEQRLEEMLAACGWAVGRCWNRDWSAGPIDKTYRLDLFWPEEKVVIEIDGPEHHEPVKYLADRRRDRVLQHHGCLVLRFTNQEILGDATAAVLFIEKALGARRRTQHQGMIA